VVLPAKIGCAKISEDWETRRVFKPLFANACANLPALLVATFLIVYV
jgi:hypothetical protein